MVKERRQYDEEFIIKLAVIDTRLLTVVEELKAVKNHLSAINGSITDYQVTKSKVENACLKLLELDTNINVMDKLLGNIKVKIWSTAAFVGIICGGVGSAVSFVIQKFGGG